MKKHTQFLTIILIGIFFSSLGLAQGDKPEGSSFQIDIPQHIQLLNQQIKLAEDNENWDQYYSLRQQIIDAWKQVNPEVANMYRTTNSLEQDALDQNAPKPAENIIGVDSPLWGDDLLVHIGDADDISLAVTRGDTLFLAALNNSDSRVDIYRSGDAGITWSVYRNFSMAHQQ